MRFALGNDQNPAWSGMEVVADSEIDDAVAPTEVHSRLCSIGSQQMAAVIGIATRMMLIVLSSM
jgi:hypothetical protein